MVMEQWNGIQERCKKMGIWCFNYLLKDEKFESETPPVDDDNEERI